MKLELSISQVIPNMREEVAEIDDNAKRVLGYLLDQIKVMYRFHKQKPNTEN